MIEPSEVVRVLLVGDYDPEDRTLVRRVCQEHKWKLLKPPEDVGDMVTPPH